MQARERKGWTQKELAERAQLSLRTVQRLEGNDTAPRYSTLQLITEALGLKLDDNKVAHRNDSVHHRSILAKTVDVFFLCLFNFLVMALVGFLVIDSNANLNSRIGATVVCIALPFIIVLLDLKRTAVSRLLAFGSGMFCYSMLLLISANSLVSVLVIGIQSGLFLNSILFLSILYFGDRCLPMLGSKNDLSL
ncbi:helix-turn-helix domain-containing protein [Nonlabens xiamenensis]|uniref:helix-turn-helix domain-containing protein n=1 Tax=Nonlabens xiamenensis TaxID=2341043 RepID=UPI0037423271